MSRVLITGGGGYVGSQLVARLAALPEGQRPYAIVSHDVREPRERLPNVVYAMADIRGPQMADIMADHQIDTVVHLAAIMPSGKAHARAFEYDVDVNGTRNVLDACVMHGVKRIVVSSSGAAYGYHADNAPWLTEDMAVRGNAVFAYADHKRLVEEMLAQYRQQHPTLEQVVLRIGTILGPTVRNQITDMFEKPRLLTIRGSDSPFVFIWDQDVVGIVLRAISVGPAGIYNVAGDGALTIHEIAQRLGKKTWKIPAWVLQAALGILKPLGLTQYGPEQLDFLRYRPVLLNTKLKNEFGYTPTHTSAQVFDIYRKAREQQNAGNV
jgi:UDP-glucose 4-epimerase